MKLDNENIRSYIEHPYKPIDLKALIFMLCILGAIAVIFWFFGAYPIFTTSVICLGIFLSVIFGALYLKRKKSINQFKFGAVWLLTFTTAMVIASYKVLYSSTNPSAFILALFICIYYFTILIEVFIEMYFIKSQRTVKKQSPYNKSIMYALVIIIDTILIYSLRGIIIKLKPDQFLIVMAILIYVVALLFSLTVSKLLVKLYLYKKYPALHDD